MKSKYNCCNKRRIQCIGVVIKFNCNSDFSKIINNIASLDGVRIFLFFRVVFRGGNDDKVVLCTDNETFEVKEAETSNSLLIVSNLVFPTDIGECEKKHVVQHKEVSNLMC